MGDNCQHNRLNFGSGDYYVFCLDCYACWMRKGQNQEYGELPDGTKIGADPSAANHYTVQNGIWSREP